jgi:peroxiredoxin
MSWRCLGLLTLLASWPAWSSAADQPAKPAPVVADKPIANFVLRDVYGKAVALNDFADQSIVVIAFLGTECPLAKLYGPRLNALAAEYQSKGVVVLGINANSQDSLTEIAAYGRIHGLTYPLLKDPTGAVADQLKAQRTPEVFVLDRKRVVCYHGRVDDQYATGSMRPEPKQNDLRQALDELLADKPVSQRSTKVVGCLIGRSHKPDETCAVTYSNQIAPLLQRRCVDCHRPGQIAPFSLTDYEEVAGWADMIGEVVANGSMPPWHANPSVGHFAGERRLTDDEKKLIKTWVAAGAPRGASPSAPAANAAPVVQQLANNQSGSATLSASEELPAIAKPTWSLGREPDAVFPMCRATFKVPGQGIIDYKYFKVDTGFSVDRWITAAEVLPGNRAVVHHVIVHAIAGNVRDAIMSGVTDGYLAVYVPGMRPSAYPPGMAKRIPAGSQLIFQVHYVANGSEQNDCCKLGLLFADKNDVEREVITSSVQNRKLVIPPGAAKVEHSGESVKAPTECQLLCMMPHMHARGSSMLYELVQPDGKTEPLLDVPRYDANWQTAYQLLQPRTLAAGSVIRCKATFDNSVNNLNNPDPSKEVHWGPTADDEMMVGYFDIAYPKQEPAARRGKAAPPAKRKASVAPSK